MTSHACRGLSRILTLFVTHCRFSQCATPDRLPVAICLPQRSAKIPPATQLNRAANTGPHRHAIFLICSRSRVRDHSLRHRIPVIGPRFRSGHLVAIKLDSHSQVSARRRNRFHSHHVPRAAPFRLLALPATISGILKKTSTVSPSCNTEFVANRFLAARRLRLRGLLWIR